MSYKVRVVTRKGFMTVQGQRYCVGNLAHVMHIVATADSASDLQTLVTTCQSGFEEFDGSQFPSTGIPAFDTAHHFKFGAVAVLGMANITGLLEILLRGKDYVQLGMQLIANPPLLRNKAINAILDDLLRAASCSYGVELESPAGIGGEGIKLSTISDDKTHCYLAIGEKDAHPDGPGVTYRIGNRKIWDSSGNDFLAAERSR